MIASGRMLNSAIRATIVTVLNLKGGVGKTHTVWLLAGVCEERGRKCLVVDLDTQGNITRSLLPNGFEGPGVEALFDPRSAPEIAPLIRPTRFEHIDVIPASSTLAPLDLADQGAWERSELQYALAEGLAQIAGDYDMILLDCPPRLSLASFAALCAAQHVVIPLELADWGAQGVSQVAAAVEHVQSRYNPSLTLLGYLASRFKARRGLQLQYLLKLKEHYGKRTFDTVVPDLARFEQSVALNVPVVLLSAGSREACIARRLFDEITCRIRKEARSDGRRRPQLHRKEQAAV